MGAAAGCAGAPNGHGCITLGNCSTAPSWKTRQVMDAPELVNIVLTGDSNICLDYLGTVQAQAYKCVSSLNQRWAINATTNTIQAGWTAGYLSSTANPACQTPGPPPPPPASPFCGASWPATHDHTLT